MANITGTNGPDSLTGTESADSIEGLGGNDTLTGLGGADTIFGGNDNDQIFGDAGNDSLLGDSGNDTIDGGTGNDLISGGTGTDTASFASVAAAVTVNLGANSATGQGTDTLSSIENVIGSSQADSITGSNAANRLAGGDGNDSLFGGGGEDTLDGGLGNDSLFGGSGTDTADYSSLAAAVTVNLAGGTATGQGTDTLNSIENAIGSSLADSLTGTTGSNRLDGLAGNDSLFGGDGTDTLFGGDDNDVLNGGLGNDSMDGGAGIDTADYSSIATAVTVNLGNGSGTATGQGNDTLLNIENAVGSSQSDFLTGGTADNRLEGLAGNDTLAGLAGNDSLYGGDGTDSLYGGDNNDVLDGGAGNDLLDGGAGIDTADFSSIAAGVTASLITGTATGQGTDALTNIENLTGSSQADSLTGGNNANVLTGGSGNDVLDGRNGDDTIGGDAGADSVYGGIGNDQLSGGDGADNIRGGDGSDTISGGSEDDIIYGDADQPSSWTFAFYNKDFTSANGQAFTIEQGTLALEGTTTDFDLTSMATQARGASTNPEDFGVILTSTFTSGVAGTYRFTTTSDDGSVLQIFDEDGNPLTFANQTGGNLPYLNNDFHQSATTRYGDVVLEAGKTYTIQIRVWENAGEQVLQSTVTEPGGTATSLIGNSAIGSDPFNTGNDVIDGGTGNDTIYGELGSDTLTGGEGNDSLYGGAGNDSLSGGTGTDGLYGGTGSDTLAGGEGADVIAGGSGMDYADYGASGAGVTVNLTTGTGLGGDAQGDVLSGIDGIFGSGFDDSLTGYDGESTVPGDEYSNEFYGAAGNDTLDGRAGNDTLYGGDDNDSVLGGAGNDSQFGDAGADALLGEAGLDTLYGGSGNDTLTGGAEADLMVGGDDSDRFVITLNTDGFGDVIDGGSGGSNADTLDLNGAGPLRIVYDQNDPKAGVVNFLDQDKNIIGSLTFSDIESVIPCFTPGTMIATPSGDVAVEALAVGDMVLTRDHGPQPLRWIGRRPLTAAEVAREARLAPVRIAAGALGAGLPERDMQVSPQHRVLVAGLRAELLFGEEEVLVAAVHLVGQPGISRAPAQAVCYLHLMFDRHELVLSDGAWTESFQPADRTFAALDEAQRAEIADLFPEANRFARFTAARRSLRAHEVRVLFAA